MRVSSQGQVLALHRVSDNSLEAGPYSQLTVSPARLEEYLVSKDKAARSSWQQIVSGEAPDDWSLLTFDDAYRDTLEVALPLLERYRVPAIVFATVGFASGELEMLSALVARMLAMADDVLIDGLNYDMNNQQEFEVACRRAYRGLERGSLRGRWRRLEKLAAENNLSMPVQRKDVFLDWEGIRELSSSPLITIGAHSWTHPRLSRIVPWALKRELFDARRSLENKLEQSTCLLAYPHGAHNGFVRTVARIAGYRFAFTTEEKRLELNKSFDPLAIPRASLS